MAAFSAPVYHLQEGFEDGAIPATWTQEVLSTASAAWTVETQSESTPLTNPNGAAEGNSRVVLRNESGETQNYVVRLITPELNLMGAYQPVLVFSHAQPNRSGQFDVLKVYYRTAPGEDWKLLVSYDANIGSWQTDTLDLVEASGTYQLAFEANENFGRGVLLDAIRVMNSSMCTGIKSVSVTAMAQSASLVLNSDDEAFDVLVSNTALADPSEADCLSLIFCQKGTTETSVIIPDLASQTKYYVYVRSTCDDNESGYTPWVSTTFTTSIGFPFIEDFSAYSAMPDGWQALKGSFDDVFADASNLVPHTGSGGWKFEASSGVMNGAHVWCDHYYTSNPPLWLVSPAIDLSSAEIAELTFNAALVIGTSGTAIGTSSVTDGSLDILFSADGGKTWSSANEKIISYNELTNSPKRFRVNMNALVGQIVKIAFVVDQPNNSTSQSFQVDDISIDTYDINCGGADKLKLSCSSHSISASWATNGKDSVVLQLSSAKSFADIIESDTLEVKSYSFEDLDPGKVYYVRVKQCCEDADWVMGSIQTSYAIPYANPFTGSTIPPTWTQYSGTSAESVFAGGSLGSSSSSVWSVSNLAPRFGMTSGYCVYASMSSYGSNRWLISPIIDVALEEDENARLSFMLAVTSNYNTPKQPDLSKNEDQFMVIVSEDGGATWNRSNATVWSCSDSTDYDLRQCSSMAQKIYVDLSQYRGKNIKVALYTESGISESGWYLFIGDLKMEKYDANCGGISKLKIMAESDQMTANWSAIGTTAAKAFISSKADYSDTLFTQEVNATSVNFTGLEPNTQYYFAVKQSCEEGEWAQAAFKTPCAPEEVPYTMDFENESANADPSCWTIVRKGGSYPTVSSSTSSAYKGSKFLTWGTSTTSSTEYNSWASMPAMENISNLIVSFRLRRASTSYENPDTLMVGVMTDPNDPETFEMVAEFEPKGTTYEMVEVNMSSYTGTGKYICFANKLGQGQFVEGSWYDYTYFTPFSIDEIEVDVIPTCDRMGVITASKPTAHGATVSFAATNAANYQIIFVTEAIRPDTLDNVDPAKIAYNQVNAGVEQVISDPANIADNTLYYIYARGVCSDSDKGKWSDGVSIKTLCDPFTIEEFGTEDFSDKSHLDCWTLGFLTDSTSGSLPECKTNAKFGNYLYLSKSGTYATYSDGAYAITPMFQFADGDSINHYEVSFSAATDKNESTNFKKMNVSIIFDPANPVPDEEAIWSIDIDYAADSTAIKDYTISFADYMGDVDGNMGQYIMFALAEPANHDSTNYVILDNIKLSPASTCAQVVESKISNITDSGADYTWNNTGAAKYEVLVSTISTKAVDTLSTYAFDQIVDADNKMQITGLNGNTMYYAYVRGICGEGDTAKWSNSVAFRTECASITTFPWTENFDNRATGVIAFDCWTNEHIAGTGTGKLGVSTEAKGSNSTGKLELADEQSGNVKKLTLPFMNIPEANAYEFRMDMYRTSSYDTKLNEGFLITVEGEEGIDTIGHVLRVTKNSNEYIDAVAADGWYTYAFTIPQAGNLHICVYGISEYGAASYADNFEVRALPTCPDPKKIIIDEVTTTSASLSWIGSSAQYDLYILQGADTVASHKGITENSIEITGLSSATSYNARLQGICANDSTEFIETTFKTALGLPYSENFEGSSSLPSGWGNYIGDIMSGASLSSGSRWSITSSYAATSNAAKTNIYSTNKGVLTTPAIVLSNGTDPIELSFELAYTGYNKKTAPTSTDGQKVGVLISEDNGATWTTILLFDTVATAYAPITSIPTTLTQYTIDLSSYAGKSIMVAFEAYSDKNDNDLYVDNVSIKQIIADCDNPDSLAISDITGNSAVLTWQGDAAKPTIISLSKNSDLSAAVKDTIESGLTYTFEGLSASLHYYVGIQQICQGGLTDQKTIDFLTSCEAIAEFPWSEDFDSYKTTANLDVPCWRNEHIVSVEGKTAVFKTYTTAQGGNSTTQLQLPDMTAGNKAMLVLPEMNLPEAYEFKIDVYRNGTPSTYGDVTKEGVRIYISQSDTIDVSAQELGFISRSFDTADAAHGIPAESASGWYTYTFALPVSGNNHIIVVGESQYCSSTYIDNFLVRAQPTCKDMGAVSVVEIGADSAIVSYPGTGAANYEVIVSTSNVDLAAGGVLADTVFRNDAVADTFVVANELAPATTYYAYVRGLCGEEQGAWSSAAPFITECQPVAEFPWSENFDSYKTSANFNAICWRNEHIVSVSSKTDVFMTSTTAQGGNATTQIKLPDMNAGNITKLTLPAMNIPEADAYEFRMDMYRTSDYDTKLNEGFLITVEGEEGIDTIGHVLRVTKNSNEYVGAVDAAGWYTYAFNIPQSGDIHICVYGISEYGSASYADNFEVRKQPTCKDIASVSAMEVGATSAKIGFAKANAADYQLVIANGVINPDSAATSDAAKVIYNQTIQDTTVISDLLSNTTYHVYMRGLCGDEDKSAWSKEVVFTTLCLENIPYSMDFDDAADQKPVYGTSSYVIPSCWNESYGSTSYLSYIVNNNGSYYTYDYAYSGSYAMYLYSYYSSYSDYSNYVVLPEMNMPLDSLQISFKARAMYSYNSSYGSPSVSNYATSSYAHSVRVGTLTDPNDPSTFEEIETVVLPEVSSTPSASELASYWESVTIFLQGAKGKYICFANDFSKSNYVWIDDVMIEKAPDCMAPSAVKVVAGGKDATAEWVSLADSFQVAIDEAGFDVKTFAADKLINVDTAYLKIDTLSPSTDYDLYVRAVCGDGLYSQWSKVTSFSTSCLVAMGVKYDFDDPSSRYVHHTDEEEDWYSYDMIETPVYMENCWGALGEMVEDYYYGTIGYYPFVIENASSSYGTVYNYAHSGSGALALDYSTSSSDAPQVAVMPAVDGDLDTMKLTFWARPGYETVSSSSGSSMSYGTSAYARAIKVGTMTNPNDVNTFKLIELVQMDVVTGAPAGDPNGTDYWRKYDIALENAEGAYIAFMWDGDQNNVVCIDDVELLHADACAKPAMPVVGKVGISDALVSWKATKASDYELAVVVAGATDTAFVPVEDTTAYQLTELLPGTSYQVRLRAACEDGVVSEWTDAVNFMTECLIDAPVTYNFDDEADWKTIDGTSYKMQNCWNVGQDIFSSSYIPQMTTNSSYYNYSKSGSSCLYFAHYYSTGYSYPDSIWAVMPALNSDRMDTLQLIFAARAVSEYVSSATVSSTSYATASYAHSIRIGLVENPNDLSTFYELKNFTTQLVPSSAAMSADPNGNNYWETVKVNLQEGHGKYIVFLSNYGISNYMWIDDVTISAQSHCQDVDSVKADVTTNSATISWKSDAEQFNVIVYSGKDTVFNDVVMNDTLVLNALSSMTSYKVKVQTVCGEETADWVSATFATKAGVPFNENFDLCDGTTLSSGWSTKKGLASDIFAGTAKLADYSPSSVTGWYGTTSAVVTGSAHPYINVYGGGCQYWLISPNIDLSDVAGESLQLTFDIALTKSSSAASAPTGLTSESDDKFMVIVSTDGGATWSAANATVWASDGSGANNFKSLNEKVQTVKLDMSEYAGGSAMIAFYGESTTANADNYLAIDNVKLNTFNPNCQGIENIQVNNITFNGVDVTFDYVGLANGDAVLALSKESVLDLNKVVAIDTVRGVSNYSFVTPLDANSDYYVFVEQLCEGDETSAWESKKFQTPKGLPFTAAFESTTLPSDWKRYSGSMDDVLAGSSTLTSETPSSAMSGWVLTSADATIDNIHFYGNIYGTSWKHWIVSPAIDMSNALGSGVVLNMDAYIKPYTESTSKDGVDDRFAVLVSADNGATWTKVAEWNNAGTGDYVYNDVVDGLRHYTINLSDYAGQSIQLAFYGESTVANADNYFHFGNIALDKVNAINYSGRICYGDDYDGTPDNSFVVEYPNYHSGLNVYSKFTPATETTMAKMEILNLMVDSVGATEYNATACLGEHYHDNNFDFIVTEKDTRRQKLYTSVGGCDSMVTLYLNIIEPIKVDTFDTICAGDYVEWKGQKIYQKGVYPDTLVSAVTGCDSIVILYLNVMTAGEEHLDMILCHGETYTMNDGTVISEPGIYEEHFKTALDCDSVVYWNVSVLPALGSHKNAAICQGETYTDETFVSLSLPKRYSITVKSKLGECDSLVSLNLMMPDANKMMFDTVSVEQLPYILNGVELLDASAEPGIYTKPVTLSCGEASIQILVNAATGWRDIFMDKKNDVKKIIKDNRLLIIRGGVIYNAQGGKVE
ncbi:MAG: choice-of-anchor J domain-containing protein [Paludibacteraceae bacterium]|nr:choice-of-anchor J domain-containing protein [Paludibacteraceae bacterium]